MVAIVSFCMETLPAFERPVCLNVTVDGGLTYFVRPNYEDPFFIVESVIMAALRSTCGHYILPCSFFLSIFFYLFLFLA